MYNATENMFYLFIKIFYFQKPLKYFKILSAVNQINFLTETCIVYCTFIDYKCITVA